MLPMPVNLVPLPDSDRSTVMVHDPEADFVPAAVNATATAMDDDPAADFVPAADNATDTAMVVDPAATPKVAGGRTRRRSQRCEGVR